MSRDKQPTRLNAELAFQFGRAGRTKQPGRKSLTDELAPGEPQVEADQEQDQEQQGAEAEGAETEVAAAEPKKSLFELPRRQATNSARLSSDPPPATAPATPKPPRRG